MKQSFKLFNFMGIPVNLSIWFFLLAFLVSFEYLPIIFISILIHELAHAYMATKLGWRVQSVELDFLQGAAIMDGNIHPKDSVKVSLAGPLSNLILVGVCYILAIALHSQPLIFDFIIKMIVVNLILLVFNLLPIVPLDGGNALRDFLIVKLKNRLKAKKVSAYVSIVFSLALLVYALIGFQIFMIFFSILFIVMNYKDLEKLNK